MQQQLPVSKQLIKPLYSLHADFDGIPNFRTRYVALGDKSGYKIAKELLENYDHFLILMKCSWFREAKEVWDLELDAKIEAEAASVFKEIANNADLKPSERITAAKALLSLRPRNSRSKDDISRSTRGRPSNEEVEGELKRSAEEARTLEEDKQRIRLVNNNSDQ